MVAVSTCNFSTIINGLFLQVEVHYRRQVIQDQALIQGLTQRGYTPEQAQKALSYMKQGVPSDQIIQALSSENATQGATA